MSKAKKQVDMYILIETHIKENHVKLDGNRIVLFGPFDTEAKAANFAHDRIAMLASEWVAEEDGLLTDCITWKIDHLLQVS